MILSFIAIVGKDNRPILLEDFGATSSTTLHFIAHSSLDIIKEKLPILVASKSSKETYLGYLGPFLVPEGDYAIYGAVNHTGVKFVVVLRDNYEARNENSIRSFVERV
jgi:hypothetical protein